MRRLLIRRVTAISQFLKMYTLIHLPLRPSVYKAFLSARPVYSAVSSSELLVRFVVRIKGKKEDKVSSRSFHGIMESCGNSAMRSGCILYIKS